MAAERGSLYFMFPPPPPQFLDPLLRFEDMVAIQTFEKSGEETIYLTLQTPVMTSDWWGIIQLAFSKLVDRLTLIAYISIYY